MRKCLLVGFLVGLSLLVGCGAGVVKTPAERVNAFRESAAMDLRQLVDDWDTLWLVDRQYRLTRWQVR
jgi:hypothetical protein